MLCIGQDCFCCAGMTDNSVPSTCALLPGCIVYPAFGCCKPVGHYYPPLDASGLPQPSNDNDGMPNAEARFGGKAKFPVLCSGCCFGPLAGANCYCKVPNSLCADEGSQFLCIAQDCSFPCMGSIPMTCGGCILPGCMFWPTFGCCPALNTIDGLQFNSDAFETAAANAPPVSNAGQA